MNEFLEQEIKKLKIQLKAYELLLEKINNQQNELRAIRKKTVDRK